MRIPTLAFAFALAALPAAAADGWSFAVSPYAWLPGMNTSLGTEFGRIDSDEEDSDVLSALDFAFMGALEARHGRWGLIGDLLYAKLSNETDAPLGILFASAEVTTKVGAATGYGYYRAYEDDHLSVDLLGGLRYYDVKVEASLAPGQLQGREFEADEQWVDGVIGLRGRGDFNEHLFATALVDYGGFDGARDSAWQVLATVGYQFNDRWSAQAGWRYLDIEKEMAGEDVQVELDGPIVGFTYRF
jgi:opacity protein-like surface antigen